MKAQKKQQAQPGKSSKPVQAKPAKAETLESILKRDKNFEYTENGKLRCKLTNHEMPATVENYKAHISSKSYKRAQENSYNIEEYQQILVDHKGDPKFLYCKITGFKIPKKKSAIEKHVHGKRFQKGLQQYQQIKGQNNGQQQELDLIQDPDQVGSEQEQNQAEIDQQNEDEQEQEEQQEEQKVKNQKKTKLIQKQSKNNNNHKVQHQKDSKNLNKNGKKSHDKKKSIQKTPSHSNQKTNNKKHKIVKH